MKNTEWDWPKIIVWTTALTGCLAFWFWAIVTVVNVLVK